MKPKVVVVLKDIPDEIKTAVERSGDPIFFNEVTKDNEEEFLKSLSHAEGLLTTGKLKITNDMLKQAPKLRIISNIAVGYDNCDIPDLNKRNIMVTNTPGILTDTTADMIFGLLIATARRFTELDQYVKKGNWSNIVGNDQFGVNVHHKKLGIIGMGRIGEAVAKRAYFGFDMEVLYHSRSRKSEAENTYNAKYRSLKDLLSQSDFVCMMVPLTSKTENMISRKELEMMKKTAILINASRGRTVNEYDLVYALENQMIQAAGLDVYQEEPIDPNHPLLKLSNTITLPHIGSATYETRLNMAKTAVGNLFQGLYGKEPDNLVNGT